MAVTLYELWRLALPPTTILHTEQTLSVVIRSAIILRSTQPALPDLHGGEVILLTPALREALNSRLTLQRLIERLTSTPIVAIATTGKVDQPAIKTASEAQIALFELPDESDVRAVQREIQRLITDQEAQYERRAAQLYAALTRQRSQHTVEGVLEIIQQWTGAQVAFPADPSMPLTVPITVDGRRIGSLGSNASQWWDQLALEQGSEALALLLEHEQAIEDRLRSNILDSLLSGVPLDGAGLARAQEQGLELHYPYVLISLQPVEEHVFLERVQAAARRVVDRLRWNSAIIVYDGAVLVALPIHTGQRAEDQARTLHTSLTEAGLSLDGGFGIAPEPEDWALAWHEARSGLKLGRDLLGSGKLSGAMELGVYRLLLTASDSEIAHTIYQQTIAPLAEHDQRQDGELVHTVHMFFAHLGNHSQAAAALHIHRNTLLYRLGKITTITGQQLDRASDRLALQVGLALHQIYRSQQRLTTS